MPRINFKAAELDRSPFPNGPHRFEIESAELTQAKTGARSAMIKVQSKCVAPNSELDNKRAWEQFVLVPQSGWKLKEFLEAADIPHIATPGIAKGEFDIECDTDFFVGKHYVAHMKQETYVKKDEANNVVIDAATGKPATDIRSVSTKFEKAA